MRASLMLIHFRKVMLMTFGKKLRLLIIVKYLWQLVLKGLLGLRILSNCGENIIGIFLIVLRGRNFK